MAIYKPINFYPNNTGVDLSSSVDFSCNVQGTVAKYRLYVLSLTNTVLYDSTEVVLDSVLYSNEILTVTVPADSSFVEVTDLKYYYVLTDTDGEQVTSKEVIFYNYSSPSFDLGIPSTLTSRIYTITPTFTQSDGIAPVRCRYSFYNNGELEVDTGWVYSGDLTYTVDFLLDGEDYEVFAEVYVKKNNTFYTTSTTFTVEYPTASINFSPLATVDEDTASIFINWTKAQYINGSSVGDVSYISGYISSGNTSLQINDDSSSVTWDNLPIETSFLISFICQFPSSFVSGEFLVLSNTSEGVDLKLGYDGDRFYLNQNGDFFYEENTFSITSNTPYLIQLTTEGIIATELEVV